jgi:protease YdgD
MRYAGYRRPIMSGLPEQAASLKQTVGPRAARASFARKVTLASVLVIAVLPFISVNVLASHRETVDANTYPWSSIGKLGAKVDRLGSCTGVVVGSNHFLTAAHCLYNKAAGRFVSAESVHLLLGYTKGEYRVRRLASRYTIPPTFDPAKITSFEPAKIATLHDDWAILYVSEPFPSEVRPLPVASGTPPPGRAVKAGGYAAERTHMMTADQHCRVKAISPDRKLIAHDCVVNHGDSGSPLLDADGDDEGLILGLNVTGYSKLVELQDQSRGGGLTVSTVSIIEFLSSPTTSGH